MFAENLEFEIRTQKSPIKIAGVQKLCSNNCLSNKKDSFALTEMSIRIENDSEKRTSQGAKIGNDDIIDLKASQRRLLREINKAVKDLEKGGIGSSDDSSCISEFSYVRSSAVYSLPPDATCLTQSFSESSEEISRPNDSPVYSSDCLLSSSSTKLQVDNFSSNHLQDDGCSSDFSQLDQLWELEGATTFDLLTTCSEEMSSNKYNLFTLSQEDEESVNLSCYTEDDIDIESVESECKERNGAKKLDVGREDAPVAFSPKYVDNSLPIIGHTGTLLDALARVMLFGAWQMNKGKDKGRSNSE